ncbi:hypothetical protein BJ508DRAFT_365871 [Ascobolus immersus RN42]|uniref:Uncharacterized protein n=1 Tax=Ascobolus immersus RN42 TaxID=1160509 RepID=A0A3N4HSR6_ASCIM|nr:hypothetical protein BJ508DRAFT_365871 [Ascobolus immersus RN42]
METYPEPAPIVIGLLDLPTELVVLVFQTTNSLQDAVALSSTCKFTRQIYEYDCRIGMAGMPSAFELLNLQRPDVISAWRNENLRPHLARYRPAGSKFKFLNVSTTNRLTNPSLSPRMNSFTGIEERKQLQMNHSIIARLVRDHAKFEYRASFTLVDGLEDFFYRINKARDYFGGVTDVAGRQSITPSSSETTRLLETTYLAAALQLKIYAFGRYTQNGKLKGGRTILNYAPLLSLSFRQCLELVAALRVLFVEADLGSLNNMYWLHYSRHPPTGSYNRKLCATGSEERKQHPIFSTSNLRMTLAMVVNMRARIYSVLGALKCKPSALSPDFVDLSPINHPLRSIFWDENRPVLSKLFKRLDRRIAQSPDEIAKAALPLHPKSTTNETEIKEYLTRLNSLADNLKTGFNKQYLPDFEALRVDRDGVLLFTKTGIKNDTSKDGYWGIFRRSDLARLRKQFGNALQKAD